MAELQDILQQITAFEEKIVEIAAETNDLKRVETAHNAIPLLDQLYHDVEYYARSVYIRTREPRDISADDVEMAVKEAVSHYVRPELDRSKITEFFAMLKYPIDGNAL